MKILSIVGTRPNFMKIAPLCKEFKRRRISHILVHTGQHYDLQMSQLFFDELGLPKPDINLGVGPGTIAAQAGEIIAKLDPIIRKEGPDCVLVVGDVTSTFAGAFVAKQLGIPVAHVESGLRSFDWSMPEEINRVLTDRISNFLFTTEESASQNLSREGTKKTHIFFVGNVMIDTLLSHRKKAARSQVLKTLNISSKNYCILTLHRPSNVDSKASFSHIISIIEELQSIIPIVFPLHPRTKKNLDKLGMLKRIKNIKNLILTNPLGYLDFLCLMDNASLVLTDSGGIQEETTVLGIPCITLRDNTERPITLTKGSNLLVSTNKERVLHAARKALKNRRPKQHHFFPPLWDGNASKRIVDILLRSLK